MQKEWLLRGYRFALYPTCEQERELMFLGEMCRDLYNALKQRYEDVYYRERYDRTQYNRQCAIKKKEVPDYEPQFRSLSLTFEDMTNEVGVMRKVLPEWQDWNIFIAHGVAWTVSKAFKDYRARRKELLANPSKRSELAALFHERHGRWPTLDQLAGYPRWKSRRNPTISIPLGNTAKNGGWRLTPRAASLARKSKRGEAGKGCIYDFLMPYGMRDGKRRIARVLRVRGTFPCDHPPPNDMRDASLIYEAGRWFLSVAIRTAVTELGTVERRAKSLRTMAIHFDLIDAFASVDGVAESLDDGKSMRFDRACALQVTMDQMRRDADQRWPRGKRHSDQEWSERCTAMAAIGRVASRIARIRQNALHVWTTRIVERAVAGDVAEITVTTPTIRQHTRSARGNAKNWGAAVEAVATLNRNTLSYAPAAAIKMLEYKSKEVGIRCNIITDDAPLIGVGTDLVTAGKIARKARRLMK